MVMSFEPRAGDGPMSHFLFVMCICQARGSVRWSGASDGNVLFAMMGSVSPLQLWAGVLGHCRFSTLDTFHLLKDPKVLGKM